MVRTRRRRRKRWFVDFFLAVVFALVCSTFPVPRRASATTTESDVCDDDDDDEDSALRRVRRLKVPAATATVNGEDENDDFWRSHGPLLREAWAEHHRRRRRRGSSTVSSIPRVDDAVPPSLAAAVAGARESPSHATEAAVLEVLAPVAVTSDGSAWSILSPPLLSSEAVVALRRELDAAERSGVPVRRPNGMNRRGVVLDDAVDGAVDAPALRGFVRDLVDRYARPIGRTLFPDAVGTDDDVEHYAFTVRYGVNDDDDDNKVVDADLGEHRDASVVTLNVNLNLPGEEYEGSSLYFLDEADDDDDDDRFVDTTTTMLRNDTTALTTRASKKQRLVDFSSPGTAILHKGSVRHAALPIRDGERYNLVVWLFGEHGVVRYAPYAPHERLTPRQRWSAPSRSSRGADQRRLSF